MVQTFLGMFRNCYSCSYELLDEPGLTPNFEQHFGYFDNAGVKKPSAIAVHNLISLLADNGAG